MIVALAVDPSALSLAVEQRMDPTARSAHERFLELWESLGILILGVEDSKPVSPLRERVGSLPGPLRKKWQTALKSGRRRVGPAGWLGLHAVRHESDLPSIPSCIHLACVDPEKATKLGVAETEYSRIVDVLEDDLEIVRFDCAELSQVVKHARELSQKTIGPDENVDDVWRERFFALAQESQSAVVLDRYAVDGLGRDEHSGLANFLRRIAGGNRLTSVNLYSAFKPEDRDADLVAIVNATKKYVARAALRPGITVRLYLIADATFRQLAHDRYVRFENLICELGTGLDVLRSTRVQNACRFTLKRWTDDDRRLERRLREQAREETWAT